MTDLRRITELRGGKTSIFCLEDLDLELEVHEDEQGEYVLLPPDKAKVYLSKEP